MSYNEFFIPRIIVMSDGEANSKTEYRKPLAVAREQGIIIDVIALLSKEERGRSILEDIAKETGGNFMMPEDLTLFIQEFIRLSKKKQATKVEDIVLLLDVSGSMSENYRNSSGKKIAALREATQKFATEKLSIDPRDRVGVVVFGSSVQGNVETLISPRPYDAQLFNATVLPKLKPQDGTPLAAGMFAALKELDVPARKNDFLVEMVVPLPDINSVPGRRAECKYCTSMGKANPVIDADGWHFYEGIRGVNAFQCPVCKMHYHGMCFDKHLAKGGNRGVCYGCNTVLGVSRELQISETLAPAAEGSLYMCPSCNEPLPPQARFCSHCGSSISAPAHASQGLAGPKSSVSYPSVPSTGFYDPAEEESLTECPSCGYSCQKAWGSCPICNAGL